MAYLIDTYGWVKLRELLADPSYPCTDDIGGDVPLLSFGLHIIDSNLGMGDLVEIAGRASGFLRRRGRLSPSTAWRAS